MPWKHPPTSHRPPYVTWSTSGMPPAFFPAVGAPPHSATPITPSLTTTAARPACATWLRYAGATTRSNRLPAGPSPKPVPATSPGPRPPGAATRATRGSWTIADTARPATGGSWPPRSGLQVLDRGDDPAVVVVGWGQAELGEDAGDVFFHDPGRDHERVGDGGVRPALSDQREHFPLAWREHGQGGGLPAGAQQMTNYFWVEHGAAVCNTRECLDEVTDVGDAVLQQVTDARWRPSEQFRRGLRLDVLGEHQHADLRVVGVDRLGGAQSLVGMGGRHAHVDDGHIGQVRVHCLPQRYRVGHRRDNVMTPAGERLGEPVPHDRGVFCDDDTQLCGHQACPGSSIVMAVGPPAGLSMPSRPSTACTRSRSPASPPPGARRAPPDPSSVTAIRILTSCPRTLIVARLAPLCLATLASSSAAQK